MPGADLVRDEGIRHGTTVGGLAGLKPSFRTDGTITAGNASPLSDVASAVLLASRRWSRRCSASHPPGPPTALARAGVFWSELGAVELNEAFAVLSLACVDAWGVDPGIVNARGGAIAIGHLLGASGGRLLGTLAGRLRESGDRWCVAAICIGVGQALVVVLENVS